MDWLQVLMIIGSMFGSAYYIHREVQADIKCQAERTDAANARIDTLYTMFYDLIREVRK
jgi:hypothetical protein